MRRKDREITDVSKITDIIESCDCCRLGFSDGKAAYIVPLNFGYSERDGKITLYFHGASEGRKIDLIRKNGHAGFEFDTNHRLIDGEKACAYTFRYQSVIGEGSVSIIEEECEKTNAMQVIMAHYSQRRDWQFSEGMMSAVSVFKLEVEQMTCKEHT